MNFEFESVAPESDQHEEELATTFIEGVVPYENPPLTDALGPILIELISTRFLDAYSSYHLSTSLATRKSFGMNALTFEFTEAMGFSPPLSTTLVFDPARAWTATIVLLLY